MSEYYLTHHGIKGMKWGVRRWQNEDGTLTAAGQARYGGKIDQDAKQRGYTATRMRNTFEGRNVRGRGTFYGTFGDYRTVRLNKKADKLEAKTNKSEKDTKKIERLRKKASAQELKNNSRALYDKYTSTGKMFAQNALLGPVSAEYYRNARARGNTRGQAFVESQFGLLVSRPRDREAYGEATWGAI